MMSGAPGGRVANNSHTFFGKETIVRFGTLCSGIEGAAVALTQLGWELAFSAEIDPYCCALLNKHYPGVPNLGDITTTNNVPGCHVIVSGTPCQSFSVQGKRLGMDEDRGQLAIRFAQIVRDSDPRWIIWENVPGVLSTNGGKDFRAFLAALAELGYGFAYRILDAQYFGVAQRRRRVFLVGNRDSWQRAAAVLFDGSPRHENAKAPKEVSPARWTAGAAINGTLFGFTGDETPKFGVEMCPTIRASQGGEGIGVIGKNIFRKLTVEELETLQGFPRGYTQLDGFTDSARRRAIGNAFCVPVIHWIGKRIQLLGGMS